MNAFEQIQHAFAQCLIQEFQIPAQIIANSQFDLNPDADKQNFGDINANIAMICAQKLKKNPKILAQEIVTKFQHPFVARIEIAGPGFLNFFLTQAWFATIAQEIFEQQDEFFKNSEKNLDGEARRSKLNAKSGDQVLKPKKINIEFVSANPTGPMHVGHGRNGILGDVLANILKFLNQDVSKEFYINDAGAQIIKLGQSFKIRCLQELGQNISLPEDAYHGQSLIDLAKVCAAEFGKNLEHEPDNFFQNYAKDFMLKELQSTLKNYGILFDVWFSEKNLHDHGKVAQALQKLIATGHTYEHDGAVWLRSTTFGDDKDRVLVKSSGEPTYILPDVAYLIDKFERGFNELIMILGHDHHSYKTRMQVIMQVLGYDQKRLQVILYQLVQIMKDGTPVKMSKRSGNMVTLEEVVEEVGKNVARFFFLNRKADAELHFDLNLALSQSNENPIYYIQYALVRILSIQKKAAEEKTISAKKITEPCSNMEKLLIKKICAFKALITNIASNHQIHLLAHDTSELATLFHQYYNQQRIIDAAAPKETAHRLFIVDLMQQNLKLALFLMGITPMEKM
ncbi:arginine--tRNA ligase [candidate division TM6 bacterium RIFCSPHIGHO2_12_FULL_38_8]|nr:MAG: arginine--tRNA ligase [candidate division TM6 bacterium RIFCSPHIGHO2_12_FULL_38_8]